MKFLYVLFIAIGINHDPAQAQSRWHVEVRPSVNFPLQVGGNHQQTGFGIEGKTGFTLTPALATYFGWGWSLFPAANTSEFSYEETGFTYGLQYIYPVQRPGRRLFVAAGGVYNHIEKEKRDGHINTNSGHRLGWQIESGVIFKLSEKLQIRPGIRYRNLQAAGIQYFSLGTGFFF